MTSTPIEVFDAAPGGSKHGRASLHPRPAAQGSNRFVYRMLGTPLGDGLSLGASLHWAELNAIDGVELLYARSFDVAQFGHVVEPRASAC